MRRIAAPHSPARSWRPCKKPLPDRGGEIWRRAPTEPSGVDLRDEGVQGAVPLARRFLERFPEHRLKADRRRVAGDQDGTLGRSSEFHHCEEPWRRSNPASSMSTGLLRSARNDRVLIHMLAAVDRQSRPGDKARILVDQESDST